MDFLYNWAPMFPISLLLLFVLLYNLCPDFRESLNDEDSNEED